MTRFNPDFSVIRMLFGEQSIAKQEIPPASPIHHVSDRYFARIDHLKTVSASRSPYPVDYTRVVGVVAARFTHPVVVGRAGQPATVVVASPAGKRVSSRFSSNLLAIDSRPGRVTEAGHGGLPPTGLFSPSPSLDCDAGACGNTGRPAQRALRGRWRPVRRGRRLPLERSSG